MGSLEPISDGQEALETQEQAEETLEGAGFRDIPFTPAGQDVIREIPTLVRYWKDGDVATARAKLESDAALARTQLEAQAMAAARATKWTLAVTVVLSLVVVVPASALTWYGKLSPDAATFLFGAIVGAAFTFLRDFFPRPN